MDHSDISDTVDSIGAFMNGGVANPDLSSCSALLVWYVKRPLKNWIKNFSTFLFLFWACLRRLFIVTERKGCLFLYTK